MSRPPTDRDLPAGNYFATPVLPYLAQFASRDRVSDFLDGRMSLAEDPRWHRFGFASAETYAFWAPRLCGVVCLKMILDALTRTETSVDRLTEQALELGGYVVHDDSGAFVDKGWFYAPLVELASRYGVRGEVCRSLSYADLCDNVVQNRFSVVSVHPAVVRGDVEDSPTGVRGGHLVVVTGFRWSGEQCLGWFVHNPSGRSPETQESAFVPVERFDAAFAGRGFVLYAAGPPADGER